MERGEGSFRGVRDSNIYYQFWLPEGNPRAVLLIVHGLGEHSGRYANVVDHFVPLGYAVYALDHLGHGRSEGTRMYVDRFTDYTNTLTTYYDRIRGWQHGAPIFLMGHSMGALIGTYYLLDRQADFAGAVISGPSVTVPEDISPVLLWVSKVLSTLTPKVGVVAIDVQGISRDPGVVQAYVNDPLVHTGKATARLAAGILEAQRRVTAQAPQIRLPILIVQGGADRLCPPTGTKALYEKIGSEDKSLKVYDGLYHEVFNEPERAQVLGDVEAWLQAHIQ